MRACVFLFTEYKRTIHMYQFAKYRAHILYTAFINKIQSMKTLWWSLVTPMFIANNILMIFLFSGSAVQQGRDVKFAVRVASERS